VLQRDDVAETDHTDLVKWLAGRERASLEEVRHFLQAEPHPLDVVNSLVQQGMLLETTEQGQSWYRVHFVARRRRVVPAALGKALDDAEKVAARERDAAQRTKKWVRLRQFVDLLQGEAARSWLGLGPLLLLFLLIEWLLVKNLDSFSQLLSIRG
jgi:hypothetical protein